MAEHVTSGTVREIEACRQMAESCREMAAVSRRPGPLINRAEAYEALALARGDKPPEIG